MRFLLGFEGAVVRHQLAPLSLIRSLFLSALSLPCGIVVLLASLIPNPIQAIET